MCTFCFYTCIFLACFGFSLLNQQHWDGNSAWQLVFNVSIVPTCCSNKTCQPACLHVRSPFSGQGTPAGDKEQAYLFAVEATGSGSGGGGPTMGGWAAWCWSCLMGRGRGLMKTIKTPINRCSPCLWKNVREVGGVPIVPYQVTVCAYGHQCHHVLVS